VSRPVFDDLQARLRSLARGDLPAAVALPTGSRAERSAALRARIVEAAKPEFAAKGYDGASVRSIAAAAGIEQGHLGYHFKTKRALWEATVDTVFADFPETVAGNVPRTYEDARTVMRTLLQSYAAYCVVCPEHARIVFNEAAGGGERLEWLVERHIRRRIAAIEPVFKAARDRGAVAPTSFEAFVISFLAALGLTYALGSFPAAIFGPPGADPAGVPPVPLEEMIALFVK